MENYKENYPFFKDRNTSYYESILNGGYFLAISEKSWACDPMNKS